MKGTNNNSVKFCFTKYIKTALMRSRRDYINKMQKIECQEELTEPELLYGKTEDLEWDVINLEEINHIPWNAEEIEKYLSERVSERMWKTLSVLKEEELLIVYAKVFRQLSFAEIGQQLGIEWKKIASVYSYARKKMRKGWSGNDI